MSKRLEVGNSSTREGVMQLARAVEGEQLSPPPPYCLYTEAPWNFVYISFTP